jgi:hypothetical protein
MNVPTRQNVLAELTPAGVEAIRAGTPLSVAPVRATTPNLGATRTRLRTQSAKLLLAQ